MITVILSLGQLISSNVETLKRNFQLELRNEEKTNSGDDVWEWMKNYLPQLRLDQITLASLCDEYNLYFSTTMSTETFTRCFNSMCEIDEASLHRIRQLYEFLNEHPDIQFVLVSHTNVSHLNYIMEQLEPIIPNCRDGIVTESTTSEQNTPTPMLFATSMHAQCQHHPDTFRWAIRILNIELNQPILSFLETIQTVHEAHHVTYTAISPNFDANDVIEKINEIHRPGLHRGI